MSESLRSRSKFFLAMLASFLASAGPAVATVIYQTGFEASEGYVTNLELVGQEGWLGAGSGGNGVVSGFFPGQGQQAYIGFAPPLTNAPSLFVYQPINKNLQQVQFSVTMAILDSTNTNWDDFYWTVYNQQSQQLLTLDFDNFELKLYYYLGGTHSRIFSGVSFTNGLAYQFSMALNYASNLWSASLDGALVATNQPITTVAAAMNLGDIDAAWVVFDPNAPGDNFMVFDDYRITATLPPPQLGVLGTSNGVPTLRVTGVADNYFAVEASTNLVNWGALRTNITMGGSFDYADDGAVGLPQRFYRARWVP